MSKIEILDQQAAEIIRKVILPQAKIRGMTNRAAIELFLQKNPNVKYNVIPDPTPPQAPGLALQPGIAPPAAPVPVAPPITPAPQPVAPVVPQAVPVAPQAATVPMAAPVMPQPATATPVYQKPLGVFYEAGEMPEEIKPFTAQSDMTGMKQPVPGEKSDLQRLTEAVPKSFMNASAKLGAAAIRVAPDVIANTIMPGANLLIRFSPEGRAIQAVADKKANEVIEYWRPSAEEQARMAEAGIPEKVAFGIADFIGQYPQFMVAGAAGGAMAASLAKSLGTTADVILKAFPLAKNMAANAMGFGAKGAATTYGETGSVAEAAKAGGQEAAMMGALPLNRLFPAAVQPLTAALAGYGLGYAQTGDVKEATTQGLMFLAMELPGIVEKLSPATKEALNALNKDPLNTAKKTKAVDSLMGDIAVLDRADLESKIDLAIKNKELTPASKPIILSSWDAINKAQGKVSELAAENVQIKAEAAIDPEMQVRIAPKAEEYIKGWDGQKNDVVLGGVDISGLGSINALVKPELESYRIKAAQTFGVPENSSAYTIGTAMKKKAIDTARQIFGNDAEVMVKGQGSDEVVIVSKKLNAREMAVKLDEFKATMPTVEIPSAKKGAEMVQAGGVYTKVAQGKNYSDFENAYSSALDIEKRAVVREGKPVEPTAEPPYIPEGVTPPLVAPKADVAPETAPLQNATEEGAKEPTPAKATVATFRQQAIDAGWKQEEVDATLGLINARAKARGETPDAWIARNNITIEKGGKMGPGALKQETAQPFYSKLRKVIDDKMPNSADVKSLNGLIAGAGVKNDEMTWSGIKDFLDGKEKVSKAELLKYLDENQVEVKEVVKGSVNQEALEKAEQAVIAQAKKEGISGYNDYALDAARGELSDGQIKYMSDEMKPLVDKLQETYRGRNADGGSPTKFSQYQLPGGENYREVLVTMPEKQIENEYLRLVDRIDNLTEKQINGRITENETNELHEKLRLQNTKYKNEKLRGSKLVKKINEAKQQAGKANFTSSHFSEPNILLHLRLNDRTTADGKDILFAEEIQSDWHQKGREEGYQQGDQIGWTAERADAGKNAPWIIKNKEGKDIAHVNGSIYKTAKAAIASTLDLSGVPPAPFSKTWHEQGLKRMLRNAAEQGKDGIGWTTGEQQAERYDLSKQVDKIIVQKTDNPNGPRLYKVIAERNGEMIINRGGLSEKELAENVGKDLAQKAIDDLNANKQVKYTGTDLKVGGEGMKGFYDKILVDYANKYGKKWGASVEDKQINVPNIDMGNVTDAGLADKEWLAKKGTKTATVHYLPITDAMRSDLLYVGQELFQKGDGGVKGSAEFPSGQTIIRAFEKADVSTLSHELAHVFRRDLLPAELTAAEKAFGVKGGNWNVAAEERFANGFEEYLRTGKAPTAELKTVFEKFKAWLTDIYQQARAHLTADQTAFYDQILGKATVAKTGKVDKTTFADLMTAIETPKENWQAVQDALRYNTPEEAQQSLKEQGIEISLDELKKAEPMIKGGAGVKREFQMSIAKGIQSVVGNIDKRIEELATINPEYKKQISDKFKQWEASDIREADQSVKDMMDWAGVEALPGYLETVTPDKTDMTLHHEQMAKLVDNVAPADLRAVERMMGKDAYTFAAAGQRLFAEAQSAAKTLNMVIEKYDKTTDAVEKAKLEKLGTALLNSAIDNYGLYRNAMTNGGRLVEYAKQNKKGEAYSDLVTFDNMMQSAEFSQFTEDNIVDAFKRIKQAKALTIDGIVKAAEPTLMDKVNEWQKAIKLTNPKTHIVNFSSNIANGFYNANIEKMLAVAIDAAGTIAGKPRTTFSGEVEAGWRAGMAAKSVATAKMLEALKNDLPNQRAWETQYNVREAIPGKAGKFVRTPFRMLNASDQYFYTINYNVALGQEVYSELYKQGKRGQKLWNEWAVKMNAPSDAQITTSKEKAEEWLYREKLDPTNQGAQKILKDAPALQFILPFYKTQVNIAKWAYRRTPIIGLPGRNMADIRSGGRQAREAIARQVAGTAIYGTVAALWQSGAITGPAPEDEDKRAEFYRHGKIPYGIKIGNRYYSYGRWEPLTTITKSLTSALEAEKQYTKDKSRGLLSASGRAIGQISQSLLDQSYLLGLSNMFDAINDPVRSGQRFISSIILGATIPTGVGYIATAVDPLFRKSVGLKEQAMGRIPFVSKSLEPRLGVLGEVTKRERIFSRLQPLVVSVQAGNNYEAWDGSGLSKKDIDYIEDKISAADAPIPYPPRYYKDDKGINHRYTTAEYNQILKTRKPLLFENLKEAILSDDWNELTIKEQNTALKKIYTEVTKMAKQPEPEEVE